MQAFERHRKEAPKAVRVSVITVSTSRYERSSRVEGVEDESGSKAVKMLKAAGHSITSRKIVNDDVEMIRGELLRSLYDEGADAVILAGGTGLSSRDVTIEAVTSLLDRLIEGFGEIFRMVSYERIGSSALLTRALAGTLGGRLVFCLPGSPHAVETGLNLIIQELPHMVHVARS